MTAYTFDHRSKHVTKDYGETSGREVPAVGIDPMIKYIDWDGVAGVVVYKSAERQRRIAIADRDKTAEDREIAETGELQITDFSPYASLITEYDANPPPGPPPIIPMKDRELDQLELEEILVEKGVITTGDITAKKNARS